MISSPRTPLSCMTASSQVISNMRRALRFIYHKLLCWEWLGISGTTVVYICRVTFPTLRQWDWEAYTGIWCYDRWRFLFQDLIWMSEKDFSEKCQMRKHTGNVEEKPSCCYLAIETLLNEHFNKDALNLSLRKSLSLYSHGPSEKHQQNTPECELPTQPYKCIIIWRLWVWYWNYLNWFQQCNSSDLST